MVVAKDLSERNKTVALTILPPGMRHGGWPQGVGGCCRDVDNNTNQVPDAHFLIVDSTMVHTIHRSSDGGGRQIRIAINNSETGDNFV